MATLNGLLNSALLLGALAASPIAFASGGIDSPGTLKSFETDGCTSFSEGTRDKPDLWAHCCAEHDLRYWFGGSEADMDHSDLELRACVFDAAGEKWAKLIYNGVRAGHKSPVKSKYRWGWAWIPKRPYSPLTVDEIAYVKSELQKLPFEPAYIDAFIEKYLGR